MTLDQLRDALGFLGDAGMPGALLLALVAIWRGWIVPKREVDDLRVTIKTQAETIDVLEAANDRLLDEIAKPLAQVLANLQTSTAPQRGRR